MARSITPERLAAERAVLARKLQRMSGELSSNAVRRMDETLPWFKALSARERASVGTLAQLGVTSFIGWFSGTLASTSLTEKIFSSAPRELADALTLEQTVELVRTTIAVVEDSIESIAGDNNFRQAELRESLLRYSSEVAFAAANVYAQRAENRGAWDARLQALVLDAILTGEGDDTVEARAAAAGWKLEGGIFVLVGPVPATRLAAEVHAAQIQRTARLAHLDALVGIQSDRLVAVVSGVTESMSIAQAAKPFVGHFGQGTVVAGPLANSLIEAHTSAVEAMSGYRALSLVDSPSRLLMAHELIAARVFNGDTDAIAPVVALLVDHVRDDVRATLANYLEKTGSIEACARALFIHVNTVRYRLKGVHDLTGLDPFDPADAMTLRIALMQARKLGN